MATYVLSDIHGHMDYFEEILTKIKFSENDKMYIIGDAIDKGPSPIDVLLKIKNTPNMIFLLGNHEQMMIQSLKFNDEHIKDNWLNNGGKITLEQFEKISKAEQLSILDWLYQRPIAIPNVVVNNKNYLLAHASHPLFIIDEPLIYSEAMPFDINYILWSREYQYVMPKELAKRFNKLYNAYKNVSLIFGHTPVFMTNYACLNKNGQPLISRSGSGHLINIDCGCARSFPLGCLRLDDNKEFYATLPKGMRIKMG